MKIIDPLPYILRDMDRLQMNRAELARRLNLSRSGVTKILKGEIKIELELLLRLSAILGTDYNLLMAPNYQGELVKAKEALALKQTEVDALKTDLQTALTKNNQLEQEIRVLNGKMEVFEKIIGSGKG